MNRSVVVTILILLLIGSNAWWLYRAADQLSIDKYRQISLDECLAPLQAALRALPPLAAELPRNEVITRVATALEESQPFEKDSVMVIAPLTLRFDARGKLQEVGTIYEPVP